MTTISNNFSSIDLAIMSISFCLFIAATPICRWLNGDTSLLARVSMMRVLNFLIIIAVIINALFLNNSDWLAKATQSLMVIYFAVLITQLINFFVRRRFGKINNTRNKTTISDTYSSRGLSLVIAILMSIIAIISCLRLMGLNSLLEAGGALGIMGLFMDGKETIATIFKTKLFHTECLDLANNHRIMVRNAKLRDYGIQNLSRFASARGLRERLLFNIDYQHSESEVSAMINRAFAKIDTQEGIREEQHEAEILVDDTGDYAVTWAVYYYIKDIKRLLKIRQLFRSYILAESIASNISLATPILQQNSVVVENTKNSSPLP